MIEALTKTLVDTLTHAHAWERISLLQDIAKEHNKNVVFSTSLSLEDQALTHCIATQAPNIRIFTLDTGRLFEDTYDTLDRTNTAYSEINIEAYYPDTALVQSLVKKQGINGFYNSVDERINCCHVRKVEPLDRALRGADIWISGLRHAHSQFRQDLPIAEIDQERGIIKCYPIIDVDDEMLRQFIDTHHIPYNALHDQGFLSIGCAPCTRAVEKGEPARAGRWWWEQEKATPSECGLHMKDGKLVRIKESQSHA